MLHFRGFTLRGAYYLGCNIRRLSIIYAFAAAQSAFLCEFLQCGLFVDHYTLRTDRLCSNWHNIHDQHNVYERMPHIIHDQHKKYVVHQFRKSLADMRMLADILQIDWCEICDV